MSGQATGEEEDTGKNGQDGPQAASCLTWCSLGQAAQLLSVKGLPLFRALLTIRRCAASLHAPARATRHVRPHGRNLHLRPSWGQRQKSRVITILAESSTNSLGLK